MAIARMKNCHLCGRRFLGADHVLMCGTCYDRLQDLGAVFRPQCRPYGTPLWPGFVAAWW
jgi:hypothetical protein